LSILRDRSSEFPTDMSRVCRYLELDETTSVNIERAGLIVRSAAATLEKIGCEKRARHFKDLWEKTDITTNAELSAHYHKQMQSEKKRIQALDRQRQIQFDDLTETPLT
jgi:DNA primase